MRARPRNSTTKRTSKPKAKRKVKTRNRVPAWAPYFIGGPDWRREYLSNKPRTDRAWKRFSRYAGECHLLRLAAKKDGASTPKRAREVRDAGYAVDAQPARKRGRPQARGSGFAAEYRRAHPEITSLSSKAQTRVINLARAKRHERTKYHVYSCLVTSISAASLNVPLLRRWCDLDLDRTPHITRDLLAKLESHPHALSWRYYRSGGGMGRLWADPWSSLASMTRDARAVLCFGTDVLDLDMSCCHHRIALMLGERYKVSDLQPLREYVADPKAWRDDIEKQTRCSSIDAKILGVILLNLGGLSVWVNTAERKPRIPDALRAKLHDFQSCCKRIKEAVLPKWSRRFPECLRRARPARRWSFALCSIEDRALRAIHASVEALGAEVVMLVYDGLMLLSHGADLDELAAAATKAATCAAGCAMPTRFKGMKLPSVMQLVLKLERESATEIAERDTVIAQQKREIAHVASENALLRMEVARLRKKCGKL